MVYCHKWCLPVTQEEENVRHSVLVVFKVFDHSRVCE